MRWNAARLILHLPIAALGLVAMLAAGLAFPAAPSAEDLRAVAHGSTADICGSGAHQVDGRDCRACCLAAAVSAPAAQRGETRLLRRPDARGRRLPAAVRRVVRRDRTRGGRAPPRS